MEEVKYIPGDLVMTDGAPIGTKKGVVYVVKASDPNRKITFEDGTVLKGIATLDNVEGMKITDKGYLFCDCAAWIKHIVPIPINKEILDKNDLFIRFSEDEYHIYAGESEVYICDVHGNGEFEVTSAEYTTIAKIQFVHQLQHLLFGLGLDSSLKV